MNRILIILNFDVVQVDYDSKIGTPVTYESNLGSAQNNSSAAAVTNPVPKQEPQQPSYNQNNNFSSGNGANMQLEANLTPIRNLNPYQTRYNCANF
jgi:replication factor A1